MSDSKDNIWDLIEVFRSSEYYKDVVWQNFGVLHASLELNDLLVKSIDEFRDKFPAFLHKYTMIREKTYSSILSKIEKVEKILNTLRIIFNEQPDPEKTFELMKDIPGCGIFVCSTILSLAFDGAFIVFSDGVWNGFEILFPSIAGRIEKPRNYQSYLQFQHACEAISDAYDIGSMAELHEFLWHGSDTNWEFH